MDEILLKYVEQVKEDLNSSPSFNKLKELENALSSDMEVKSLSLTMNEKEKIYNEAISNEGENSLEARTAQKEFSEAKNALYSLPLVKEYLKAYREYQDMLDEINNEIISPLRMNLCPKK